MGRSNLDILSVFDTLAEWSKAPGRGPGLFGGAGSNPAGIINFLLYKNSINKLKIKTPHRGLEPLTFRYPWFKLMFKSRTLYQLS